MEVGVLLGKGVGVRDQYYLYVLVDRSHQSPLS